MHRAYHRWYSPRLHQDMELLVFGHSGARVLVFPTRTGRFYDYENWGMIEAIRSKVEQGWLQLFCVDSIDAQSIYAFWAHPTDRIRRHMQYEEYLLEEVLPLTQSLNPNPMLITHGCSMGAYHAVNMAFRHPDLVGKVVAFSGRYDLTRPAGDFRDLFDGFYDESIYFNTPAHYLANLSDPHIIGLLRRMEIILTIGEYDPFIESNQQLSQALWDRNIWHALHVWRGRAHRPAHWKNMSTHYL
jgi:esterase/lipase superfamily enzyme